MTWNCQIADPSLSLICPRSEKQIDPRVHPGIIGFLVDGKTDGFCEYFAKFDQNHAMNRAIGKENRWFAKCRNSEQEFSHPMIAHAYLDVINEPALFTKDRRRGYGVPEICSKIMVLVQTAPQIHGARHERNDTAVFAVVQSGGVH